MSPIKRLISIVICGAAFLTTTPAAKADIISILGKAERGEEGISIQDYFCLCVTAENCPCMASPLPLPTPDDPIVRERGYTRVILIPDEANPRVEEMENGLAKVSFESSVPIRFSTSYDASIDALRQDVMEFNADSDDVKVDDEDIQVLYLWGGLTKLGKLAWKHRVKIALAVEAAVETIIEEFDE
ncbi:hypothetical protein [Mameliella sediminis]|uniref:hypothetical protein n=1 Tax=Mameliella sediminis TaxID=2836866 RepID=UPI001C48B512|nr:hypothetical protein [Mameliella sediminis]MBV7394607.1 hypothetical protein [Mameliella sediminis]MBY6113276.1 hypothetical protein [Antarctobacter heliothermus]MBY6143376.1 hypothetical protein [Mameliella alba]MCA0952899.1 hypothetical protein [Mameliella alba]